MKFSPALLLNWLKTVAGQESVDVYVPPVHPDLLKSCPTAWRDVLTCAAGTDEFVDLTWGAGGRFSKTSRVLRKSLQGLALLIRESGPELLYIFTEHDALKLYVGKMPTSNLPVPAKQLNVDLQPLYSLHNGFLDLTDSTTGFAAIEDVQTLDTADDGNRAGDFLKIFEVGSNCLGFDLSDPDRRAYIIWGSDEVVEGVDSFWVELDEWLASQLEDYDDANS